MHIVAFIFLALCTGAVLVSFEYKHYPISTIIVTLFGAMCIANYRGAYGFQLGLIATMLAVSIIYLIYIGVRNDRQDQ